MSDDFGFNKNRVYRSLLSAHFTLSSLFASIDFFVERGTQDSVSDLTKDVEILEEDVSKLKEDILSLLKNMVGEEESPLVEITENGLKM